MIEGRSPDTGDILSVETRGDRIVGVRRSASADASVPWLIPGLIDLQVNGYAGLDVNGADATPESVAGITQVLAGKGVTTWVPTIITASQDAIVASMRAITAARDADPMVAAAIPFAPEFGVATECGIGRAPAGSTEGILRTHAEIAAAW